MNAEAEGLTHHLPTSLVRIFHLCFLFPNPFQGLTCYGYLDYFSHDNKGYWDLHDWNTKTGLRRNIGATIKAAKNSKTESDMGQAANKDWDGASSSFISSVKQKWTLRAQIYDEFRQFVWNCLRRKRAICARFCLFVFKCQMGDEGSINYAVLCCVEGRGCYGVRKINCI